MTSRGPFNRVSTRLSQSLAIALAGILAGAASHPALSQLADEAKQEIYQVEVIVFAQPGNIGEGDEIWRTDIDLDYPQEWRELLSPAQLSASSSEAGAVDEAAASRLPPSPSTPADELSGEEIIDPSEGIEERAMLLLPEEALTLQDQARRLSRNRQRILFHGAWRQPMVEDRQEPSILISGGELFDQHHELEGSIKLYLRTYLHIETDLWLSRFATNFGQEGRPWPKLPWPPNRPPEPGQGIDINDGGTGLWHQFNQNRNDEYEAILAQPYVLENVVLMQQSRRMRSSELHYIDHPKIGVLLKITPYQEEDAEQERAETDISQ